MGKVPCISLQPSHRNQISSLSAHSGHAIDDYQVQAKTKKGQENEGSNDKVFPLKGYKREDPSCSIFWKTLHPPVVLELHLGDS